MLSLPRLLEDSEMQRKAISDKFQGKRNFPPTIDMLINSASQKQANGSISSISRFPRNRIMIRYKIYKIIPIQEIEMGHFLIGM